MFGRNFSENAYGETWTRERLTIYDFLRQTELQPCLTHFVFKQLAHGFDEFEVHFLRQSADVVMALDHLRGIALDRNALNHVRVKSSLRQEFVAPVSATGWTRRGESVLAIFLISIEQLLGGVLKYFDEFIADQLALRFGIGHSFEQREKAIAGVYIF